MPTTHVPLIQSFLDYLAFQKRYSANTIISYRNDLFGFFDFIEHHSGMLLTEINPFIIRSWLAELKEPGEISLKINRTMSPLESKSIRRNISSLKSFFRYQLKQGTLVSSPMTTIISPKIKKRLPQFVASDDINNLFNGVEFPASWDGQTHQLILQLLYHTGMRRAELVNLEESQIDKSNSTIKVFGKGNKERVLPIGRYLMLGIQSYMAAKRKQFEYFDSEALLVNIKGRKLYPKYVHNVVQHYLSMVTTIDKKSPHVLRHTFATHLMNNGADLNAVKELLGHSSLAATQVYTHNTIEKLKAIHNRAHPKA